MPTITYDKKDLLHLIGKKMSDEQLEDVTGLIKPTVERMTKDEVTVELTPDRPDLFGIEGLARSIRQYLEFEKGLAKYKIAQPKFTVRVNAVPVRPFVVCAVVRNVKTNDETIKSLMNIQEVLHETIGRKRKKVAIGLHDLDKIKSPISYVGVAKDTKIIPLSFSEDMTLEKVLSKVPKGKTYGHLLSNARLWPVLRDVKGIFSFPPIINSDRTKVTSKTKNIFIDVTGTNREAVRQTLNILVTNLAERGFKIEAVKLKHDKKSDTTPNLSENVIEIDKQSVNKWIGLQLNEKQIVELLERMGYKAISSGEKIEVLIPAYRTDVIHPVDIMEDVAIAYGYNNFTVELPNIATIGSPHPLEKFCSKIRQLMLGFGFQEVSRPIMSNIPEQFDKMNVPREPVIEVENSTTEEYTCLRPWLLPSMMRVLSANKHVSYPQNIFEIGDVVWIDKSAETKTRSVRKMSATVAHSKASFAEIKSIVESLLRNLGVNYSLEPCLHGGYTHGRGVHIMLDKKVIGSFGEVNPKILENWKMEVPVASCEMNLEVLL